MNPTADGAAYEFLHWSRVLLPSQRTCRPVMANCIPQSLSTFAHLLLHCCSEVLMLVSPPSERRGSALPLKRAQTTVGGCRSQLEVFARGLRGRFQQRQLH